MQDRNFLARGFDSFDSYQHGLGLIAFREIHASHIRLQVQERYMYWCKAALYSSKEDVIYFTQTS